MFFLNNRLYVYLLISFSSMYCQLKFTYDNSRPKGEAPFIFTVPKSGTHLLHKAVLALEKHQIQKEMSLLGSSRTKKRESLVLFNHIQACFNDIFEGRAYNQRLKIILIRDPRDCLISQLHWLLKTHSWIIFSESNYIDKLKFKDQLNYVILYPDKKFGMRYQFSTVKNMSHVSNLHIIKFEDLVGPRGGGCLEKQVSVLKKLASYFGFQDLSNKEYLSIANSLFGDTNTFRKGKIGGWKNCFSNAHKDLIKQRLGEELIYFGYEKDLNW